MEENIPIKPTNRMAIVSVLATVFTVSSFCIAVAPIPFTGWICYPAAGLLGMIALITGLSALHQIGRNGENGKFLGLISVWVGGLTTIGSLCAMILGILSLPLLANFFHQIIK